MSHYAHLVDEAVGYGSAIVGKTVTIIQASDLKVGDTVIPFNVINIGHEVPLKVRKVTRVTDQFYDIEFVGRGHRELPRFAHTCIFGRVVDG